MNEILLNGIWNIFPDKECIYNCEDITRLIHANKINEVTMYQIIGN